jgi:hypothetical protein
MVTPADTGSPESTADAGTPTAVLGLDVGGTDIRGATANPGTGELANERVGLDAPHPATPGSAASAVHDLLGQTGVTKKSDEFVPPISLSTELVTATLHYDAGIVGAAMYAPTDGGGS